MCMLKHLCSALPIKIAKRLIRLQGETEHIIQYDSTE